MFDKMHSEKLAFGSITFWLLFAAWVGYVLLVDNRLRLKAAHKDSMYQGRLIQQYSSGQLSAEEFARKVVELDQRPTSFRNAMAASSHSSVEVTETQSNSLPQTNKRVRSVNRSSGNGRGNQVYSTVAVSPVRTAQQQDSLRGEGEGAGGEGEGDWGGSKEGPPPSTATLEEPPLSESTVIMPGA